MTIDFITSKEMDPIEYLCSLQADLMNHSPEAATCLDWDPASGSVVFRAEADAATGEQVDEGSRLDGLRVQQQDASIIIGIRFQTADRSKENRQSTHFP